MIRTMPLGGWPLFASLLAGAMACGSDLLLPDPPGGGDNVALAVVNGNGQVGTVGEPLPNPLVVQVTTARELPAPGRQVAFEFTSDAGLVTPDIAVTNDDGQAVARWVLGTRPGSYTVHARLADVEGESRVAEFTAEAKPASPDTVTAQSPVSQPGRRGQEVGAPPMIRVVDRFGNPVAAVPVAWTVVTGQGSVSQPITQTAEDGTTGVAWRLGERIGVQRLTAAIGPVTGSPVTFTATVLF